MEREEKTAEELQQLMQRRLDMIGAVHNGDEVIAPGVERDAPDHSGCNWKAKPFKGPAEYAPAVRMIVEELRASFRLRD